MSQWWWCLVHQRVEPDDGCANAERLGPFATQEEAARALEIAQKRNEEWDQREQEWDGNRPKDDS